MDVLRPWFSDEMNEMAIGEKKNLLFSGSGSDLAISKGESTTRDSKGGGVPSYEQGI